MFRKIILKLKKYNAQRKFAAKLRTLTSSDLCIDCGANIGDFTYRLASTGAQVIAFEPEPFAFSQLQQKVGAFPNVTLINAAVSINDGEASLYRSSGFDENPIRRSLSSSLLVEKSNVTKDNVVQVPVVNFIAFCRNLNRSIKLIKMDIEGSEVSILEAMIEDEALLLQIDSIFVETHERKIPSTKPKVAAIRRFFAKRKKPYVNLHWH